MITFAFTDFFAKFAGDFDFARLIDVVQQEFRVGDVFAHEFHEWTRTSGPLIFVITLRQHVLSANYTNAVRMIDGLKRFVIFVIARAILRVIESKQEKLV